MTLWRTRDVDTAILRAEAEAEDYAADIEAEYLRLAQGYLLFDPVGDGAEVFSLLRTSPLDPEQDPVSCGQALRASACADSGR